MLTSCKEVLLIYGAHIYFRRFSTARRDQAIFPNADRSDRLAPVLVLLSTERDHVKIGSTMLLMQLVSGFSVGWSQKASGMVSGQVLVGECIMWPTPGNRKK